MYIDWQQFCYWVLNRIFSETEIELSNCDGFARNGNVGRNLKQIVCQYRSRKCDAPNFEGSFQVVCGNWTLIEFDWMLDITEISKERSVIKKWKSYRSISEMHKFHSIFVDL